MNVDLYTIAAFAVGILAGALAGVWLAGIIFKHRAERLERKVLSLSDNKFQLKGQRVRLKQLEQRLDAEAASIPLAERELKDKSGEIRELTTALNETTALTSELTKALRARKTKVQQLQVEQSKWLKRNKALLLKSEATEDKISGLQKEIATHRSANETLESQVKNGTGETTAAPARAASHRATSTIAASGSVDRLTSRMQEMESELQNWFERVDKLEAKATGQHTQANGLALLEEVLRGEATKQEAAATDEAPQLLGSRSAS